MAQAGRLAAAETSRLAPPDSNSQQRDQCPPPSSNRGGACVEHCGMASGQRGWNRQPAGGLIRLGGWPLS